MHNRTGISLLIVCALLGACSTAPERPVVQKASALAEQEVWQNVQKIRTSQAYTLQPGDLIEIQVFQEENMQRTLRISSNGSITFPLVGTVQLGGLSLEEAQKKLVQRLTHYLKNPQVSILVTEYGNKTVYVLGQVQRPAARAAGRVRGRVCDKLPHNTR